MAPTTPQKPYKRHEYDTTKRTRFFHAFNNKENEQGVGTIAHLPSIDIPTSTARLWIKQRDKLGDLALRSQRKTSSTLGRPPKVSASDLKRLTLLPNKPSARTLQKHANRAGVRRFKKPYQTKISEKNQALRR